MPTLYAEIDINAPQSVVWEALTRKDEWRFWNTFLYDCDPGLPMARGTEIFLSMQRLEGDEETEFQPLITMMRSPAIMRWTSSIPGLRSEHMFELRETVPGRTRYLHRENFSGVLSKVFLPFIRQDERQGMRRMAQQLKMHVENNILGNPRQDYRQGYGQDYQQGYGQNYGQDYGRSAYDDRQYRSRPPANRPYDDRRYSGPSNERGYDGRNDYPRDYPPDYNRPRRR